MENSAPVMSPDEKIAALEARVEQLESKMKKIANFWDHGDVELNCNHLQVKAPNGEPRVELVAEDNVARVILCGKYKLHGEFRAEITPENDVPEAWLKEKEIAGEAELVLYGYGMTEAARFGLNDGHGTVEMASPSGVPGVTVKSLPWGGVVSVVNEKGETRALMRLTDEGDGSVEVFGEQTKRRGAMAANPNGGSLLLWGAGEEKPEVFMMAAPDTGALYLGKDADQNGVRLVSSPDLSFLQLQVEKNGFGAKLSAHDGIAGLELTDGEGAKVATMSALIDHSQMTLLFKDDDPRVELKAMESQGVIEAGVGDAGVFLSGGSEGGIMVNRDAAGKMRTMLQCNADEGLLMMSNEEQKPRVALQSQKDGAVLSLFHEDGTYAPVVLRSTEQGGGYALCNAEGENVGLFYRADETCALHLNAPDGTQRAVLTTVDECGKLGLMGETGSPRIAMGSADDHGQIVVFMSGGDMGAILGCDEDGGSLLLCEEDNQPRLTLPDDLDLI